MSETMRRQQSPIGGLPAPSRRVAEGAAYRPPKSAVPIRLQLDRNEGKPPPEWNHWAAAAADEALLRRYPVSTELAARLAQRHGVSPQQVLVTSGGDESLQRICLALLDAGAQLLLPSPTFEMIAKYAALAGAEIVEIPWGPQGYPLEDILDRLTPQTRLIAVVSPNNPTGATVGAAEFRRLVEAVPHVWVLVDAAYAEFADEDLTGIALQYPNTIVVRTFSKAWGLAGLRVGYSLAQSTTIEFLRRAGGPYPVATVAHSIVCSALAQYPTADLPYVRRAIEERSALTALLRRFGLRVEESSGNFVYLRTPDAERIYCELQQRGIAVRWFPVDRGGVAALRISCPGAAEEFVELCSALEAILLSLIAGGSR